MKATLKLGVLMIGLLSMTLSGCDSLFDKGDTEKVYTGPSVVEFFPLTRTLNMTGSNAVTNTTVAVQLIGRQRSADEAIAYTIDPASTAVAGTHYTISTPSPVTLAANTSSVNINITLIPGSVPDGQERRLILQLTGNANLAPAANLKTATINIRP